jgi:hypothetical protein
VALFYAIRLIYSNHIASLQLYLDPHTSHLYFPTKGHQDRNAADLELDLHDRPDGPVGGLAIGARASTKFNPAVMEFDSHKFRKFRKFPLLFAGTIPPK